MPHPSASRVRRSTWMSMSCGMPAPANAMRACWPARMSWMPVAAPVDTSCPARSGMPRRAQRARANRSAASVPPAIELARPVPTECPSMKVSQRRLSSPWRRQSGISGPSTRPALLPKSETTTAGPRRLMSGKGLPASSTPTRSAATSAAASSSLHCVLPFGASAPSTKTNSASTAAKPPSITANRAGSPAARCTLSAKIGPTRRSSPIRASQSSGILPTFQPATSAGHRLMAASWTEYPAARLCGSVPG